MTYYYSLQIDASKSKFKIIDEMLGVKSNNPPFWELQLTQKKDDEPIPFIDYFISILKGKYEMLEKIGIYRKDITVWMLYEYEGQCNMEFSPTEMEKLGNEGITLCISCWEK